MRYMVRAIVESGGAAQWAQTLEAIGWHIVSTGHSHIWASIEAPRKEWAARYANAAFQADFGRMTGIRWVQMEME
jgi:hypothetical protein